MRSSEAPERCIRPFTGPTPLKPGAFAPTFTTLLRLRPFTGPTPSKPVANEDLVPDLGSSALHGADPLKPPCSSSIARWEVFGLSRGRPHSSEGHLSPPARAPASLRPVTWPTPLKPLFPGPSDVRPPGLRPFTEPPPLKRDQRGQAGLHLERLRPFTGPTPLKLLRVGSAPARVVALRPFAGPTPLKHHRGVRQRQRQPRLRPSRGRPH